MRAPDGFVHERSGRASLVAEERALETLRQAGMTTRAGWERIVQSGAHASGRGRTARVALADGRRIVVKQLRRGGALRSLWRDRFVGTERALANIDTPIALAARGIPTARPVALLVCDAAWGLVQAWLATEEIAGADDLTTLYGRRPPPPPALTVAMLDAVRRAHDAGLVHGDLNLGNLLARQRADGGWEIFVVDLDRARVRSEALGFRTRLHALRRLERSAVKQFGSDGPPGAGSPSSWYGVYARGDAALAEKFAASRRAGRTWLALHRLGWKEQSR